MIAATDPRRIEALTKKIVNEPQSVPLTELVSDPKVRALSEKLANDPHIRVLTEKFEAQMRSQVSPTVRNQLRGTVIALLTEIYKFGHGHGTADYLEALAAGPVIARTVKHVVRDANGGIARVIEETMAGTAVVAAPTTPLAAAETA